MPCPLTQNYTVQDCLTTAGVKSWIITPFSNMLTAPLTANVVTAITKTATFKSYAQPVESGTWSYTGNGTTANGSRAYDWEATVKTIGLGTADQQEFDLLIQNKLVLIAEMNDGTYWMLGRTYGSISVDTKFEAGTAMNDYQGTMIIVKGRSNAPAVKVDATIIPGLLV